MKKHSKYAKIWDIKSWIWIFIEVLQTCSWSRMFFGLFSKNMQIPPGSTYQYFCVKNYNFILSLKNNSYSIILTNKFAYLVYTCKFMKLGQTNEIVVG